MRRIAILGAVIGLIFVGAVVSRVRWVGNNDVAGNLGNSLHELKIQKTFEFSSERKFIEIYGRRTSFDIPDADVKDVEVKLGGTFAFNGKNPDAVFLVTIKGEQPPVLTSTAYEKIQPGMTYPQVGGVLGGVMARGLMSEGFTSRLELAQGKRRIYLTFAGGKVAEKSAKDLE